MKRSEMIKCMLSAWKTYHLTTSDPEKLSSSLAFKEVLDMMEKKGMLPPFNAALFGKIAAIEGLDYHKWDPEDD